MYKNVSLNKYVEEEIKYLELILILEGEGFKLVVFVSVRSTFPQQIVNI